MHSDLSLSQKKYVNYSIANVLYNPRLKCRETDAAELDPSLSLFGKLMISRSIRSLDFHIRIRFCT